MKTYSSFPLSGSKNTGQEKFPFPSLRPECGDNYGSSLLCVGNGKIELSSNEIDDGDQIPG